jgi:hypothetical protein
MSITLTHFCTLTGKHKLIDDKTELTEQISSCVLESLIEEMYPDTHQNIKYYVGSIYEGFTNSDDCVKHPGKSLISSSRDRFIFASVSQEEAKAIRTEIFDEELYAAQYGSNLLTDCRKVAIKKHQAKRILIVDGETGECGGVMPPEKARLLVGDGDGRVSRSFAKESGFSEHSQFQTRGFILQQPDANFSKTCLVKGTLTPTGDLGGYDLVLSTDQVGKGRKTKENKVKPGEYTLDISLGVVKYAEQIAVSNKTIEILENPDFIPNPAKPSNAEREFAQSYGLSRTGIQFWNCLPESGREFAALIIEDRLKELRDIQSDPRKIAWDYIKSIERRIDDQVRETMVASEDVSDSFADNLFEQIASENEVYTRIKTDLENHFQIIEGTDIQFLNDYIRKEYMDCATGGYVKFNYGMLKTNNSLADGEIRVANLPDNENVVFYRPPVPNSNVIGVLSNNRLAGSEVRPGTIEMSRKTYDALNADTDGDQPIFASKQEVCARYARQHADWYAEYTGDEAGSQVFYENKLKEYSSAFDGFVAEIKFYQQPDNRYKKITTPEKAPYEHDTFEETALAGIKNSVGFVANKSMLAIALEKEVDYLPKQERLEYIYSTIEHIQDFLPEVVVDEKTGETHLVKNGVIDLDEQQIQYFKDLQKRILQIDGNPHIDINTLKQQLSKKQISQGEFEFWKKEKEKAAPPLDEAEIEKALSSIKGFTRNIVDVLAQELEIEVQSEKSARRCDEEKLKICSEYLAFRSITALADRNKESVYTNDSLMDDSNYTVADALTRITNLTYKETELSQRPGVQFKHLFQGVEYDSSYLKQQMRDGRTAYSGRLSDVFNRFSQLKRQITLINNDVNNAKKNNTDFLLKLNNSKGVELEIAVDKKAYKSFNFHDMKTFENLQIIINDSKKILVTAALTDEKGNLIFKKGRDGKNYPERRVIGELTQRWINSNKDLIEKLSKSSDGKYITLKSPNPKERFVWSAEIRPVANISEVNAARQALKKYVMKVREEFQEKGTSMAAAAALWKIDTSRMAGYNFDEAKKDEKFYSDKISRVAITIFPKEVAERLKTLQAREISISTLSQEKPEEVAKILSKYKDSPRVPIEIRQIEASENPDMTNVAIYVENIRVGSIYKESPQLPVGTTALATVPQPEMNSITATTVKGTAIKITNLKQYSEYSADERAALINQQRITFDYAEPNTKASRTKPVLVAKINDRIVGAVGNNRQVEEALLKVGVRKIQGFTFNAVVEAKVSTYLPITIVPESVVYPEVWQRRYSEPIIKEDSNVKNVRAGGETIAPAEFKPVLFENKSHLYKNGDTTEYRPVIGITSEKSHAPIIEDWLKARGVLTHKPSEYTQTELSLNAETILVDPRSLNEAVKVELIKNFGRILDASTPEISISNNLTDPIYYLDKNQRFTDLSTGEITVAPSWGIVINNNEAELVDAWLKQKELHPLTIVEKEENNTTFVVKDIYTRDRIRLELLQSFGEPIDVGTEAGYEQYNENYEKLGNANVDKPEATVKSEYQTQLENLFGQTVAPVVIDVPAAGVPNKELETVKGDLLQVKSGIIVQQVNCQGVMGAGLAQAIVQKYPQVKAAYKAKGDWELGDVQFVKVSDKLFVANVAGQDEYGTHQRQTDFEALRKGLVEVEKFALEQNLPVMLPERLGSGLAGGRTDSERDATWEQIKLILKETLPDAKIVSKNSQCDIVSFATSSEANKNTSLEILGKISDEKVAQLREHLETHYLPLLAHDKSNYAPGRQIAWVGAEWGLKDKDFKPAVQDDKLMELIKQVYPDAELALVTFSNREGQGIGYHRDDSYANADARSINIGDAQWGYQTAKQSMVAYDPKEDRTTPIVEFKLDSGTITRFNSKNAHAALHTEAQRWSINIWSIKNNERGKFEQFLASNQPPRAIVKSPVDLTIKNSEWTSGGEIQVLRSFNSLTEAVQYGKTPASSVSIENLIELGNQTATRAATPHIPDNFTISGKPVPMNYELHNFDDAPQVPVNTTIEAMRGYGRVHTTRGVDYEKAYSIKEGDIALAVGKGGSQVAFRVGKQYEITQQMVKDPSYQKVWADWEKHSPKELTQNQALKGKIYGLFIEPLGDYVKGKIIPFPQVQQQTLSSAQVKQPPQREQWETNLIKTCFETLKQTPENIEASIQTAPLGSSTITFDTSTQTLAITNSASEKIYECKRGEVATISNLNKQQQEYFNKLTKTQIEK